MAEEKPADIDHELLAQQMSVLAREVIGVGSQLLKPPRLLNVPLRL
jgi:hypothetical protein